MHIRHNTLRLPARKGGIVFPSLVALVCSCVLVPCTHSQTCQAIFSEINEVIASKGTFASSPDVGSGFPCVVTLLTVQPNDYTSPCLVGGIQTIAFSVEGPQAAFVTMVGTTTATFNGSTAFVLSTSLTLVSSSSSAVTVTLRMVRSSGANVLLSTTADVLVWPCIRSTVSTIATARATTQVTATMQHCLVFRLAGTVVSTSICCDVVVSTVCSLTTSMTLKAATLLLCKSCTITTVTRCFEQELTTTVSIKVRNFADRSDSDSGRTTCAEMLVQTECTVTLSTCVELTVCTSQTAPLAMIGLPVDRNQALRHNTRQSRRQAAVLRNVQSFPNPVQAEVTIKYELDSPSTVWIQLCDHLGRDFRRPMQKVQEPGQNFVTINTGDVPAGVYYYKLRAGKSVVMKKLVVVK